MEISKGIPQKKKKKTDTDWHQQYLCHFWTQAHAAKAAYNRDPGTVSGDCG